MFSRSWLEVTSGERNAIVFERLNKSYGAYEIRTNYDRTLLKALVGASFFIILLSATFFISREIPKAKIEFPVTDSKIIFPPITEINPITPKTAEPQIKHQQTNPFQHLKPPVVTEPTSDDPTDLPANDHPNINSAQPETPGPETPQTNNGGALAEKKIEIDTTLHTMGGVDENPKFPGGENEMSKFIQKTIDYERLSNANASGKAGVYFIVEKDGSLSNIVLYQGSSSSELNNEAIRIVKKMPNWEPGKQKGKPVRVKLILPIRYSLK